jgi:thiol:disulfide interchange protein
MEIFKQLTAVIFFATVIWLVYVYGSLFSGGAAARGHLPRRSLLGCFLILAVAGWVLGKWPAAGPAPSPQFSSPPYRPRHPALPAQRHHARLDPLLQQQALDQARAAGHPVFIDFTAAWCLSCQVNERLVLKSADVQHQFSENKVTLLRADWTQYDPEITQQLASVNRSGVPTYVIYPAV